jgi:hypothetical protein
MINLNLPTIEQGATELESLRAFAQAIMEAWPMGDLDGGDLQAAAEKHGLLKPETRYEPCGEGCSCAEYADAHEFAAGVTCYRKTALLKGGACADCMAAAKADGDTIQPVVESTGGTPQADASVAFNDAINFALLSGLDGLLFLELWREGNWEAIEQEFPEFDLSSSRAVA